MRKLAPGATVEEPRLGPGFTASVLRLLAAVLSSSTSLQVRARVRNG